MTKNRSYRKVCSSKKLQRAKRDLQVSSPEEITQPEEHLEKSRTVVTLTCLKARHSTQCSSPRYRYAKSWALMERK
jgi:hypothetical protein